MWNRHRCCFFHSKREAPKCEGKRSWCIERYSLLFSFGSLELCVYLRNQYALWPLVDIFHIRGCGNVYIMSYVIHTGIAVVKISDNWVAIVKIFIHQNVCLWTRCRVHKSTPCKSVYFMNDLVSYWSVNFVHDSWALSILQTSHPYMPPMYIMYVNL